MLGWPGTWKLELDFLKQKIDDCPVMFQSKSSMSLYQHQLFTLDLNKVIAVYQNGEEPTVVIQTDDQRKLEVSAESPEAAVEFLNEFADQWEKAVGHLLRHAKYVFFANAIYSIQVEGEEIYIYFRDHSVSFALDDEQQALDLLADLTNRWQKAIGDKAT